LDTLRPAGHYLDGSPWHLRSRSRSPTHTGAEWQEKVAIFAGVASPSHLHYRHNL